MSEGDAGDSGLARGQEITAEHASALDALDPGYWWLAVRRAHVEAQLSRIAAPFRYLDFGCGTGTLTVRFVERLRPLEALGIDGTHGALAAATARGLDARYADFREPLDLPFRPDVITSLDVLEHLSDPPTSLAHLAQASAPGATLIVTVPAMPSLFSGWDEACGHHRRYTRRLLRQHLEQGGWRPLRTRYIFAYGVPPVWIQRRLLGRVQEVEFPEMSAPLNALLTVSGHLERWLGAPFPFGTSLFAVARRA